MGFDGVAVIVDENFLITKEPIVAAESGNDYPTRFAFMTKVLRSSSDQISKLVNPFVSVHFQNVSIQIPVLFRNFLNFFIRNPKNWPGAD